jgi:predicted lysophospholipase L1 biosynthesis ABC-type transport system permease subunit
VKRVIAGLLVLALSTAVLPASGTARAGRVGDAAVVTTGRTAEPERWWGVAGAIVCGLGMNILRHYAPGDPGVIAATIGGCVLAIMDVATT